MMKDDPIEDVLDALAQMPKLHRSVQKDIFKQALENLDVDVSRLHLEILKVLYEEGTLHVAEIADLLLISKPQMTHLIDELIELEMVERQPNTIDRRKTNIVLAPKGEAAGKQFRENIRENLRTKLAALNKEQLVELAASLRKIGDVIYPLR